MISVKLKELNKASKSDIIITTIVSVGKKDLIRPCLIELDIKKNSENNDAPRKTIFVWKS